MLTYVFPGEGSQERGMGADLFERYYELVDKADAVLGFSLKELCLEDPGNELSMTQYTQPALYAVNVLSYLAELEDSGVRPDYVTGHSLGEYAALFAAGVFDFETGLSIVKERGRLMSQASGGGMAAVIGFSHDKVSEVLSENSLTSIDIANYNSSLQVVLSGPRDDIEGIRGDFEAAGVKRYIPLKVSGAFHSRYMEQSGKDFASFIDSFEFNSPSIPVISNVTARPLKTGKIKEMLAAQIVKPVQWNDSICYLWGKDRDMEFRELGPGRTLSGLIARIKKEGQPLWV